MPRYEVVGLQVTDVLGLKFIVTVDLFKCAGAERLWHFEGPVSSYPAVAVGGPAESRASLLRKP